MVGFDEAHQPLWALLRAVQRSLGDEDRLVHAPRRSRECVLDVFVYIVVLSGICDV